MLKLILGVALIVSTATAAALDDARSAYQRSNYAEAARILTAAGPKTAAEFALLGQSYFMSGDFKRASESLEKATAMEPASSVYHHWLGRAYGRRAETSSPFTAPGLATKARRSFERAVELDDRNAEAVNDLFEYYLEAPGFLGGGVDKAVALSAKIRQIDTVEYHYALAKIAEHRKDYQKAEEQLRMAAQLAPRQIGRVLDLAKFLAKRGKIQESEAAFAQAEKIAPDNPKLLIERARTYIRSKRNLEEARALLQRYLNAKLTPDLPSREEAQKLLKESYGG
ncbi:MAG: tetratricopeptide repeat protein [Bryobacteraceae bacterium]|nr:tetratricopeptide repeat protein [Bryobacteraceae bacterium]